MKLRILMPIKYIKKKTKNKKQKTKQNKTKEKQTKTKQNKTNKQTNKQTNKTVLAKLYQNYGSKIVHLLQGNEITESSPKALKVAKT